MSAVPAWLKSVFDECASCSLDSDDDREKLAAFIVAKLETLPLVACISSAVYAQLWTRSNGETIGDTAKRIGRNGAQSILLLLEAE